VTDEPPALDFDMGRADQPVTRGELYSIVLNLQILSSKLVTLILFERMKDPEGFHEALEKFSAQQAKVDRLADLLVTRGDPDIA